MIIQVIHPSRSRPEKAKATHDKWMSSAVNKKGVISWQLCLDMDDPKRNSYLNLWDGMSVIHKNNRSAVDAINQGAKVSVGDILIVVSDDTDCPIGWDDFLLKWLNGKSDFICKVADGIQPWIITMPIMDRAYYNRFGYIYHPDYQHMFCDTELTCVADLTGRKLTSNILFKHNHYSVTKEQPDAVNKKADATWAQGEALFLKRAAMNFGLKPEEIKGKITSSDYINWMRNKGVRI